MREKSDSRKSEESSDTKSDEGALKSLTSLSKNPQESPGMKVTATVPPLPNLVQRNQDHSTMQNQSSVSRNDDEGSFAAALRKLAQQAIVPTGRRPSTRERQGSPSAASHNSGEDVCMLYSCFTFVAIFWQESIKLPCPTCQSRIDFNEIQTIGIYSTEHVLPGEYEILINMGNCRTIQ